MPSSRTSSRGPRATGAGGDGRTRRGQDDAGSAGACRGRPGHRAAAAPRGGAAIARRIADERGWTLGREVGWQVRFERQFGPETRLLLATEGILTARLQQDPLLSGFRTIVLDEFHERSIHADLGIALAGRRGSRATICASW